MGGLGARLHQRFFSLVGPLMFYFTSDDPSSRAKGLIAIHDTNIQVYDPSEKDLKSETEEFKLTFCFVIKTKTRRFLISCESREDRDAWIEACVANSKLPLDLERLDFFSQEIDVRLAEEKPVSPRTSLRGAAEPVPRKRDSKIGLLIRRKSAENLTDEVSPRLSRSSQVTGEGSVSPRQSRGSPRGSPRNSQRKSLLSRKSEEIVLEEEEEAVFELPLTRKSEKSPWRDDVEEEVVVVAEKKKEEKLEEKKVVAIEDEGGARDEDECTKCGEKKIEKSDQFCDKCGSAFPPRKKEKPVWESSSEEEEVEDEKTKAARALTMNEFSTIEYDPVRRQTVKKEEGAIRQKEKPFWESSSEEEGEDEKTKGARALTMNEFSTIEYDPVRRQTVKDDEFY
jgi:hypothetical protein